LMPSSAPTTWLEISFRVAISAVILSVACLAWPARLLT
jgi:hypothetical protein